MSAKGLDVVLDKKPRLVDNKISFNLVSADSSVLSPELDEQIRQFYGQTRNILVQDVTLKQVPRWLFMRRKMEWSEILGRNLGYGVGDPKDPASYFDSLTELAKEMRASDIHVFPTYNSNGPEAQVRLRIDGVLRSVDTLTIDELERINREIHHRCEDTNKDHRRDNKIIEGCFPVGTDSSTEYRVTSSITGEENPTSGKGMHSTAIRLIQERYLQSPLPELGFLPNDIATMRALLRSDSGFFAVVGPTGAGKTTTAYSLLYELQKTSAGSKRIITFENPIEGTIPGVTQFRISNSEDSKKALDYGEALKYAMRQDPDAIFVGEALGPETGRYIADAAQTSHLYMMTMHAENAAKAIGRLGGWNIGSRTLNDTLLGIISQKLLRRACPECSTRRDLTDEEINYFFPKNEDVNEDAYRILRKELEGVTLLESATGKNKVGDWCVECQGTKYAGRVPIVEVYTHSLSRYGLVRKICENNEEGDIEMNNLFKTGRFAPMGLNALYQMFQGNTSPSEVKRMFQPRYFHGYSDTITKHIAQSLRDKRKSTSSIPKL